MPNVLLVIPPGITPHRTRDEAIETARRLGGKLFALIVLDPAQPARVASSLDSAFVGERVSERVVEVLAREQRTRAETMLHAIGEHAARAGVPFTPVVEEGDPGDVCARLIRTSDVRTAILVAEKQSWLTRFLSRSAAVKLPALAGCEVRVMEENET